MYVIGKGLLGEQVLDLDHKLIGAAFFVNQNPFFSSCTWKVEENEHTCSLNSFLALKKLPF